MTTKARNELEKLYDECKEDNHKWEEEENMVCNVCSMYLDEYNNRKK